MAKKEYTTRIKSIQEVAKDTFAVAIEKPKGFTFKAGQYTELHLLRSLPHDQKGNFREFSISSAPHEDDLLFVFRKGMSIFKNALITSKVGEKVKVTEPVGEFVLPDEPSRDIIFLVGGIGMTAIRTMIVDLVARKSPLKTMTFYSNPSRESTAFYDELTSLPKNHTVIFTMTQEENGVMWDGETSRIDAALLEKHDPHFREKQFYIVGPAGFVSSMVKLTRSEKIPFSQVKLESFGTYGEGI